MKNVTKMITSCSIPCEEAIDKTDENFRRTQSSVGVYIYIYILISTCVYIYIFNAN